MAVNQQTLDWINQQKAQGKTDEEIKTALTATGWQKPNIEEAFVKFSNLSSAPPPPSSSINQSKKEIIYAGFWIRWAAACLDGLILLPISILVASLYLALASKLNNSTFSTAILYPIIILLYWSYNIFLIGKYGATPGKMIFGIKVTKNGTVPGQAIAIFREVIGRFVCAFTLNIGYLIVAFSDKKQGLHDQIAGTVVILKSPVGIGKKIVIAVLLFVIIVLPFIFMGLGGFALFNLFKGLGGGTKLEVSGPNVQVTGNSDLAKEYVTTASGKVMDFKNKNGKFPDPFEFGDIVEKPPGLFLTAYYPGEKASISAKATENEPGWCWNSEDIQIKVCE